MPRKTTTKEQENGHVPLAAIPHLYNIEMLKWQKANFEALKAIHEVLESIHDEMVKSNKRKK